MTKTSMLSLILLLSAIGSLAVAKDNGGGEEQAQHARAAIQLGPRPFFLVDDMEQGALKQKLASCANGPFRKSEFSIGHRGAPLQFPEHTRESYLAAARMGAGILECDVTFTRDKELVCRHSQCDLHTTTNILATPLANKCSKPFTPAVFDADGRMIKRADARCCASDLTLAEFKGLRGKMDDFNPAAKNAKEYMQGTARFRTDLYAGPSSGQLLTHKESIALFKELGVGMTPELKAAEVRMPFEGFTQADYAQKMIDEYKQAGVDPERVWPQSFAKSDVLYWIAREPDFGRQAVYLDDANSVAELPGPGELAAYKAEGINVVAPPLFALLDLDGAGNIVPSQYARNARAAGLDIIAWTLERSGILADGNNGFYFQTVDAAIKREGDTLNVLDVLARDVGIKGIFSDWPATTTYYANCMKLK